MPYHSPGCFWGTEHIFLKHYPRDPAPGRGITKTMVGYIGGKAESTNPDYRTVCNGATGHAEAVRIEFDPDVVGYAELVEFFYRTHDPTTVNRQGGDAGTRKSVAPHARVRGLTDRLPEYRSAIFTTTPEQMAVARRVTDEVQAKHFTPKVMCSSFEC